MRASSSAAARLPTRALGAIVSLVSCGRHEAAAPIAPVAPPPPPPPASVIPVATSAPEPPPEFPTACPKDMVLVDTTYCPKPVLHCLKSEYDKANHITICHRFAPGQACPGGLRRERFCIDRYEYPNEEGAHPPVMVSAYDGAAACEARGKRLCWQSEWESACEGPEKLPFPYGLARDPTSCNIDNPYVKPDLDRVYSRKPEVQDRELLKLDQSVASGERPGCTSGFGVHDLTGNVDEWVLSEEHKGKSGWAGLKGGAWGHVRNACRPMTTSHPPEFTYYFISFRCCGDALPPPTPSDAPSPEPTLWHPPPAPRHAPPGGAAQSGWTTKERGPNRPR